VADTGDSREVSRILREAADGRAVDMGALMPLVYDNLRAIARRRMADERRGHTLQPTALVNEAYLKLVGDARLEWTSKAHFYGAAAEAMRRILIDHARGRGRAKRGGGRARLPLDVVDLASRENVAEILSVDEALRRLEKQDARAAVRALDGKPALDPERGGALVLLHVDPDGDPFPVGRVALHEVPAERLDGHRAGDRVEDEHPREGLAGEAAAAPARIERISTGRVARCARLSLAC